VAKVRVLRDKHAAAAEPTTSHRRRVKIRYIIEITKLCRKVENGMDASCLIFTINSITELPHTCRYLEKKISSSGALPNLTSNIFSLLDISDVPLLEHHAQSPSWRTTPNVFDMASSARETNARMNYLETGFTSLILNFILYTVFIR
jgi:hypothetical protein